MIDLEELRTTLKQVQGVVRGSDSGEVFAAAGQVDAETLCAVAAVSADALIQVGELFSAGPLERWHFTTQEATYYASERGAQRLVAVGEPVRNAETTCKALHALR
jgi:predicted regulator of Ras-like GTPase activity (Roadblock/LC7/MglB family)